MCLTGVAGCPAAPFLPIPQDDAGSAATPDGRRPAGPISREVAMIRANARGRLTAKDLTLVLLLLAGGSAARRAALERQLEAEGPDPLLDDPALFDALLRVRTIMVPSDVLLFYVLVRHALLRAGVESREVADYLAVLLLDFGRRDRAQRVDWHDDQRHRYVVDIVQDLEQSNDPRRFKVMVHLGNYTLWLSGMYPDWIAARRQRRGGPGLSYYEAMGRRGFALASDHALASALGMEEVLRTAAERFGVLRRSLNGISDRMLFPASVTDARIERELGGA